MSETRDRGELLLGIDIGGTKVLGGLVDPTGQIVARRQRPTRPDHVLPDVIEACRDLLDEAGRLGQRVSGIGVGAKGAVDRDSGRLVGSLYLGHGEIPMGECVGEAFGLPVRVENDVHAATMGELIFGIGRHTPDFLFFNAGTGMAIGLVIAGRLYRGASNTAGENGHMTLDGGGAWPCSCGLSGCVETMIVAAREGRRLPPFPGCDVAVEESRVYAALASNLSDLLDLFDPTAVVLAGGMLNGGGSGVGWLITAIKGACGALSAPSRVRVHHAFAGRDAGLVGAAALLTA
jgi:glucokinase